MPIEEEPVVGATYENEEGRSFEVVAFDVDDGTIEIQYEDETLDEFDLDAWYEMELKRIAAPKGDEDSDEDDDLDDNDADDFDEDDDNDEDDFDDDDEED